MAIFLGMGFVICCLKFSSIEALGNCPNLGPDEGRSAKVNVEKIVPSECECTTKDGTIQKIKVHGCILEGKTFPADGGLWNNMDEAPGYSNESKSFFQKFFNLPIRKEYRSHRLFGSMCDAKVGDSLDVTLRFYCHDGGSYYGKINCDDPKKESLCEDSYLLRRRTYLQYRR
ncbi:MAG: hypothetical protein AB7K68_10460 [Bacteriovoracia bacterium]